MQSYNKRATEEFKDLFSEFRSRSHPSGYVLLKPVDAKSPTVSIEGCNVSVPSTNPAKRVRLSSRVSGNECPIVPKTTPQLREAYGVIDGEIPSLGCIPDTDFEVVAGSLSSTFSGRVTMNTFCGLLIKSADQGLERPNGARFTQLLTSEQINGFKAELTDPPRHYLNVTEILRKIVEICRERKETVLLQLKDDYAKAAELYDGDDNADTKRMRDFFQWVTSSHLNPPVCVVSDESDLTTFIRSLHDVSGQNFKNLQKRDTEHLLVTVGDLLEMTR